jgi:hypothetical protein
MRCTVRRRQLFIFFDEPTETTKKRRESLRKNHRNENAYQSTFYRHLKYINAAYVLEKLEQLLLRFDNQRPMLLSSKIVQDPLLSHRYLMNEREELDEGIA